MTNILPFTGVSRPSPAFPAGMETSERDFYAESLQADPADPLDGFGSRPVAGLLLMLAIAAFIGFALVVQL